jgi:hypothetical protein
MAARQSNWDVEDSLSGTASGSLFSRIAGGMAGPVVVGFMGARACITRHAVLPGRGGASMELLGPAAMGLGVGLLGLSLFLHFHFIWTPSERLYRWAEGGKAASLIVFVGGLGYMAWRILVG